MVYSCALAHTPHFSRGSRFEGQTSRPTRLVSYCEQNGVFKAGNRLNDLAWNNKIGLGSIFVGLVDLVMVNRNSWGCLYFVVRGEILGFTEDKRLRKHSSRMFSLIKNESLGIEDD